MQKRKRLGNLPVRHTQSGRAALARVSELSRSVMNYAKAGQYGYAYDELRQLYGAAGEVMIREHVLGVFRKLAKK